MSMTALASAAPWQTVSQQFEHFLHVIYVLLAQFHRLLIILQVVIAVRQAHPTLVGVRDHLGASLK